MTDNDPKPRKYPASMTAKQFIALLDEMVVISLAERTSKLVDGRSRYETFYKLNLTDIHEASDLFDMLDRFNTEQQS
jgi:hypothetical protein